MMFSSSEPGSFTDTNEMKKMKIKPSLRFHLFHRNKDHNKVAKL